jgi:hypothetical protein
MFERFDGIVVSVLDMIQGDQFQILALPNMPIYNILGHGVILCLFFSNHPWSFIPKGLEITEKKLN